MLADIGLFRDRARTHATVESLLKEKREADRLAKARAKDMSTINSILIPPASAAASFSSSPSPSPSSPSVPSSSPPPSSSPSSALDMSLITSLTQRLSTVEKIASKQAKSLGLKDRLLNDLQMQLKSLESNHDASLLYKLQKDLEEVRSENDSLKKQLSEMETFLNDYGLVWVGFRAGSGGSGTTDETTSTSEDETRTSHSDEHSNETPTAINTTTTTTGVASNDIYFDVPSFLASVNELNMIASDGSSMRIHTNVHGVTKFLPPVSLDLILYKDGMWFRNGPLRVWSLKESREFIKDIQEGYFPYELKDEYPEGVCLAIIDRSKVYCHDMKMNGGASNSTNPSASSTSFTAFAGKGNRLEDGKEVEGSSPNTSPATATAAAAASGVPTPPTLSSAAPPPQPLESFLSKLPSHVIQNGKVIEVRGEIGKMLTNGTAGRQTSPSPSPPTTTSTNASPPIAAGVVSSSPPPPATSLLLPTPALTLIRAREAATPEERLKLGPLPPIATLQIKMDPTDESRPILLKLLHTTTVKQVKEYINQVRKDVSILYELRTTYPPRNFLKEDDERTILEAGLTPNAQLFVRNKRPVSGYRQRSVVEQPKPDESWNTPINEG